jgi:DNA-directed RNA polymerase specialized sigma24 family protein
VETRAPSPWTDAGQDPELLKQAQDGDLSALRRIIHAHRLPLWRACLAVTQHLGEAERLFQVTIARAAHGLSGAPAGQPLLPWLVWLAREYDATRVRRRDPSRPRARRPDGGSWEETSPDAPDVSVQQQTLHAYSLLDSDDQWLLTLRLVEELSYDDIAKVSGLSVEAVAERLALAREHMDRECGAQERAA